MSGPRQGCLPMLWFKRHGADCPRSCFKQETRSRVNTEMEIRAGSLPREARGRQSSVQPAPLGRSPGLASPGPALRGAPAHGSPGTCASPAAPSPHRVRSSLEPNGRISKLPGENRRSAASHQVNRCNIMTRQKCFSVCHIAGIDSSCVCLVFVPSSWLEAPQTLGSPEN